MTAKTYRLSGLCEIISFSKNGSVGFLNRFSGRKALLPSSFKSLETLRRRPATVEKMLRLVRRPDRRTDAALARRRLLDLIRDHFLIESWAREDAYQLAAGEQFRSGPKDFASPARAFKASTELFSPALPRRESSLGRRLRKIGGEKDYDRRNLEDVLSMLRRVEKIPGCLNAQELCCLYFLAQTIPEKGAIVEVGSLLGRSTCTLALGGLRRRPVDVYAVDLWPQKSSTIHALYRRQGILGGKPMLIAFKKNVEKMGLDDVIHPIRRDSRLEAARWKKSIALLFVDGSHLYDDVRRDLGLARHLVPGGVLVFDDFGPAQPGVEWAAREHVLDSGLYEDIHADGKLLWARRKE
ncbi:MAG: class I SAM-dependent methyltransferase [Elusimicrobiota bacterium]